MLQNARTKGNLISSQVNDKSLAVSEVLTKGEIQMSNSTLFGSEIRPNTLEKQERIDRAFAALDGVIRDIASRNTVESLPFGESLLIRVEQAAQLLAPLSSNGFNQLANEMIAHKVSNVRDTLARRKIPAIDFQLFANWMNKNARGEICFEDLPIIHPLATRECSINALEQSLRVLSLLGLFVAADVGRYALTRIGRILFDEYIELKV